MTMTMTMSMIPLLNTKPCYNSSTDSNDVRGSKSILA